MREHRGDGHTAVLVAAGIDGQEAHVLAALAMGKAPTDYGRLNPLTPEQLAAVMDGLRDRGLVEAADQFTDAGRDSKERIEALTDALPAPAYEVLTPDGVDQFTADLGPIAT